MNHRHYNNNPQSSRGGNYRRRGGASSGGRGSFSQQRRNRNNKRPPPPASVAIQPKCSVCEAESPKYKCPKCRAKYCSIACCKKHKEVCQLPVTVAAARGGDERPAAVHDVVTQPKSKYLSNFRPADGLLSETKSKATSNDCFVQTTTSANDRIIRRQNGERRPFEDLEDEWKITDAMKEAMKQSTWLREELSDLGLQQIIQQIASASKNVMGRNNINSQETFQEGLLNQFKSENPQFKSFLDELLVLTGVLEEHGEVTKKDPAETWPQEGEKKHATLRPLVLKPLPSVQSKVGKDPDTKSDESSDSDSNERSGSSTSGTDESSSDNSDDSSSEESE